MNRQYQFVGLRKRISTRKHFVRLNHAKLPLIVVFLAISSMALASTTWYVNGVYGNNNNNCMSPQSACKTIGHTISRASSGDSIVVAAATYKENLTIGFSLKITGSAASITIVDGGAVGTVVTISNTRAHVTLSNVTIRNGHAQFGAGVFNSGALTIDNSTVTNNHGTSDRFSTGGGISNGGSLTITNSTVSGNNVGAGLDAGGGGIANSGTTTITNSTVSGNGASSLGGASGGGIYNHGKLAINNSTISGNAAKSGGGIYNYPGYDVTLQNSTVANSSTGGNCEGTMTSNGYNVSSDGSCNFNGADDLNNTDPMLGPLRNNGGPTQTQALLSGSPAIDAGNPSGCRDGNGNLLKTDQRGQPRPDKEDTGGCDIGAYERQSD